MKNQAIICLPADTVDQGLRMKHLGEVNVPLLRKQHRVYCDALASLEFELTLMPPENRYPDSFFVEDPAVILNNILVKTRLANPKRQGEEGRLISWLQPYFAKNALEIEEPGFLEGGDVLIMHKAIYVGVKPVGNGEYYRTNPDGAEQLAKIAHDAAGFETHIVEIPQSYLHLKGEVTFHENPFGDGKNLITVSKEIAHHFEDSGCELIVTPKIERFGANCISSGNRIIAHAHATETIRLLRARGFDVRAIETSELMKIDGAMSCCSKIW